jgi:protein TonB
MLAGNALYSPYGAHELKARYQLNLTLAVVITVLGVGLILSAAWMASQFGGDDVVVIPPKPRKIKPWEIPPPPLVIPGPPEVPVDRRAAALPKFGPPEPVPDEEILDDNVVIASRDELATLIDSERPGIAEGTGGVVVDLDETIDDRPAPYEFQKLEIQPEMVLAHKPQYPRLIKEAGITGDVVVRVLIDERGDVIDVLVHVSSGVRGLDDAAREAAFKNKFKPGIQNGRAVQCWASYKVSFKLD